MENANSAERPGYPGGGGGDLSGIGGPIQALAEAFGSFDFSAMQSFAESLSKFGSGEFAKQLGEFNKLIGAGAVINHKVEAAIVKVDVSIPELKNWTDEKMSTAVNAALKEQIPDAIRDHWSWGADKALGDGREL